MGWIGFMLLVQNYWMKNSWLYLLHYTPKVADVIDTHIVLHGFIVCEQTSYSSWCAVNDKLATKRIKPSRACMHTRLLCTSYIKELSVQLQTDLSRISMLTKMSLILSPLTILKLKLVFQQAVACATSHMQHLLAENHQWKRVKVCFDLQNLLDQAASNAWK